MAKLMDVSDNDVAVIEDTIAERLALGISQAQAQRQAVDEALAQLREERAMVMKAIDEQLGKAEPDRVEPVTNRDDVVGNQGGRSADDSTPGDLQSQRDKFAATYRELKDSDPKAALDALQNMRAIDAKVRAQESSLPKDPENKSYRGEHEPPMHDSGSPLHDLKGAYPDDFYGPKGQQYYGIGDGSDARSIAIVRSLKGKPSAQITIYRAIPSDVTAKIGKGDWVTIDRQYAEDHGDGALNGKYKIIQKTVRADELFTNGDSILEWGYDPKGQRNEPPAPKSDGAKQSVAAPAQKPRTLLSTITAAIDKAYPNLRTKLEAKGLLTIGQTLDEVTTAAAQARADKTGESVEDVKASMMGEVSNSVAGTYEQYQSIAASLMEYAESDGALQFGRSTAKDIETIVVDVGQGKATVETEYYAEGDNFFRIYVDGKPIASMSLRPSAKIVEVNTAAGKRDGGGKLAMAIAYEWAYNNGYKVVPNGGLTPINQYRWIESMLSAALRHGTTQHMRTESVFGWSRMGDTDRLLTLLRLSYENTIENAPSLRGAAFDQASGRFMDGRGNVLGDDKIREALGQDDVARSRGIGVATFKKALVIESALQSEQNARGLANALVSRGNVAKLPRLLYSSNGDIQGFFDPVTGQAFLIADNLTEKSAPGVLIHEVGIHMANDGTLEPVFKQALRLLKLGKGNPWFDGVRARLESAGETSGEEAAAYIAETIENDRAAAPASVMKWFNDFKAAIKAWLFKKGVFISSEDLSAADIAAIARANAKSVAAEGEAQGSGEDVSFSQAGQAPAGSWDAPPDSRMDKFLQKIQDGKLDLKRIQQAIVKSGKTIAENFDARLAETLYAGRVATRADRFMKSEAQPLLEAMAKNNVEMNDLSDYLLARHAPERNAQIAKVNDDMPDGGAGTNSKGVLMTTQAANDYIANLSTGKRILFEMLAKKVDAISKGTRDLLVAEGLETQETIDNWVGAYKHYVPLFKDEANGESFAPHPIGSGFSVKGGASKRAMGSDKEVTNMLSHLLLQREAALTRAEKNRVGMALYGLALTQPNSDFWTTIRPGVSDTEIEEKLLSMGINPDDLPKTMLKLMAPDARREIIGDQLEKLGIDRDAIDEMGLAPMIRSISKTTGKVISTPNPLYKNLDNAIVLKVEGKDRVIMFNKNDPRAMRLVQNLKNLDGVTGIDGALRIIGKPTRWISSLATQYNPAFGMVNLVRDTQGALTNLSSTKLAGKQFQVISNLPAAIAGIARGLSGKGSTPMSKLYEQFQEDGGQTGYRDAMRDPKERTLQIEKDLKHLADTGKLTPRNAAMAVLNLMDGFNTTLENGTRLAAYKVALDNGMSRPEAARLARELTVDFNRKGSLSNTVGPAYAFFNAAVQGTARTVETLKGPTGRKIIAGGLGIGVMQALMLVAAGYDDDEIEEFSKARALIIPRGDKKYISIPLPLGLHVLPNTGRVLTELAMSQGKEWDKKLFSAVGEIAGAFNPLGGGNVLTPDGAARTLAPTVIDPLVDLATGKDFAGRPISKATMPGDPRPGYLRGRESTYRAPSGEVYTGIAKALNTLSGGDDFRKGYVSLTPEESRYIVMTIGGGLLREIEKATNASIMSAKGETVPTRQIPLGSRFAGEVDDASVQHSRYYKNSSKVADLEAELKALAKAGRSEDVDKLIADKPAVQLYKLNDKIKASISKLNKLASENLGDKETLKTLDDARTENMRVLNEAIRELERESAKQ